MPNTEEADLRKLVVLNGSGLLSVFSFLEMPLTIPVFSFFILSNIFLPLFRSKNFPSLWLPENLFFVFSKFAIS
jgi:hypothetical protein